MPNEITNPLYPFVFRIFWTTYGIGFIFLFSFHKIILFITFDILYPTINPNIVTISIAKFYIII